MNTRDISEVQISYLMSINKAHLVMLVEENIVPMEDAKIISKALQNFDSKNLLRNPITGELPVSYIPIEKLLIKDVGDIAGNLHIARSNNDLGVSVSKMALRERILDVIKSALKLEKQLLICAEKHIKTDMVGYTHTQHGQPTTMGHYLMAFCDMLVRDMKRYRSAFFLCNRSSMGAAAITTSGFPISRSRVAELLAFAEVAENSYDAISGADHIGELATCIQLACINIGRVVCDFLLWCTEEFDVIKLSDEHVGNSSIMPQKRNPSMLENIRISLSRCIGITSTVLYSMHNTPYGDIGDIKATPSSGIWESLDMMERIYIDMASTIKNIYIDKEILHNRVMNSFCTVTELADNLVRCENISFRTAHQIVSNMVKKAKMRHLTSVDITTDMLNEAAQEVIKRMLTISQKNLIDSLNPIKFIEKRSRLGGPNPQEVMRMISDRWEKYNNEIIWCTQIDNKWKSASVSLNEIIENWSND